MGTVMGSRRKTAGFSLLEAVILVTIMSIVAVAAGVGLQSIVRIPKAADNVLAINRQLASDMEQLKAGGWAGLTVGVTNNNVTINGTSYARTITIAQANPDGSGNKTDFEQVTVTIGNQSVSTYVTQP